MYALLHACMHSYARAHFLHCCCLLHVVVALTVIAVTIAKVTASIVSSVTDDGCDDDMYDEVFIMMNC